MTDDNVEVMEFNKPQEVVEPPKVEEVVEEPKEEVVEEPVAEVQEETNEEESNEQREPKNGFERQKQKWQTKLSAKDQQIEMLMNELQKRTPVAPPVQQTSNEPTLEYFGGNIEAYTKAYAQHVIEQNSIKQAHQARLEAHTKRVNEYKATHPEYDSDLEEANDSPAARNASQEVLTMIVESDVGPQLQHYLAKNIDELQRIDALPPHRRLAELGKLEDKLSNKQVPIKAKAISNAPAPVKPAQGSAPKATKNLYEMSTDEVMDYLENQEKEARKAGKRVR